MSLLCVACFMYIVHQESTLTGGLEAFIWRTSNTVQWYAYQRGPDANYKDACDIRNLLAIYYVMSLYSQQCNTTSFANACHELWEISMGLCNAGAWYNNVCDRLIAEYNLAEPSDVGSILFKMRISEVCFNYHIQVRKLKSWEYPHVQINCTSYQRCGQ